MSYTPQAVLKVDHVLRPQGHHVIEAVEQCGTEVASYLSDISNWQQPISLTSLTVVAWNLCRHISMFLVISAAVTIRWMKVRQ